MGSVLCCCEKPYPHGNQIVDQNTSSSVTISLKLKVILLGDSRVGKTTFFKRFVKNSFEETHKRTIGPDFVSKTLEIASIDDEVKIDASIQCWDTAGHRRYRDLCLPFYKGADIVFFVYDLTNRNSLENLEAWIKKFAQQQVKKTGNGTPYGTTSDNEMDEEEGGNAGGNINNNNNNNNNNTLSINNNTMNGRGLDGGAGVAGRKCIGIIIGNKSDCMEGIVRNEEESIIQELRIKYPWIKGDFLISCKENDYDSKSSIIKAVQLYASTFIDNSKFESPQTSDILNGEQTPLINNNNNNNNNNSKNSSIINNNNNNKRNVIPNKSV